MRVGWAVCAERAATRRLLTASVAPEAARPEPQEADPALGDEPRVASMHAAKDAQGKYSQPPSVGTSSTLRNSGVRLSTGAVTAGPA